MDHWRLDGLTPSEHYGVMSYARPQPPSVREGLRPLPLRRPTYSVRGLLVLDVGLDDLEWCPTCRNDAVRGGPEVLSPQGTGDLRPVLLAHSQGGDCLQRHDERRESDLRRVGDQQMGVILVCLERVECRPVAGAHLLERGPERVRDASGHHLLAVLGHEDDMGVEFIDHMPAGAETLSVHHTILALDQCRLIY